jgi:SAM-dependent methyltransferase
MTTLPPDGRPDERAASSRDAADQGGNGFGGSVPSQLQPHVARDWAESFGRDAERYDRARPRYPEALIERIVAASPGRDVLDVGCGTGIAARQFAAAGCRVLGVDVDPRMAELARGHGIEVEVGRFEDWDPAGRGFDAVVAAQAWHWVDAEAGARQAARVLRPYGRLALFWNVARTAEPALAEAFAGVYRAVLGEHPIFGRALGPHTGGYSAFNDRANEAVRRSGAFEEPEDWEYAWDRTYTRDEWLDVVPTQGGHNTLTPGQLERVLAGIAELIDAAGGSFLMHYDVTVATAVRRAA